MQPPCQATAAKRSFFTCPKSLSRRHLRQNQQPLIAFPNIPRSRCSILLMQVLHNANVRTQLLAMIMLAASALADYCPPSSPQSDGMRDIMLIYGGPGKWTKADFLPYVAYLDRDGKPRDWFYDAYLFMMYGGAPSGQTYIDGATNKADWEFFIAEEFAADREFAALDAAIAHAAQQLRLPPPTVPVLVMIPYPSRKQTDFGDVDGDGASEDLRADAARQKAVAWFLRTFLQRWQQQTYRHLKLWGFYWMNEGIHPADEAVVRAAAGEIHRLGYKFHWIPWFNAPGVDKWRELGFDLVIMQPNYAFIHPTGGLRIPDEDRLTQAANQCRRLGMGIEMELNEALLADPAYRINLQLYLDHGDHSLDGYQAGAVRAYYQGTDTIARLCRSPLPGLRRLYDDLYHFHKGTYKRRRPYQPLHAPRGAECLVDGLWATRHGSSVPALKLTAPQASLTFDLSGRLVGDVRVHFAGSAAPQRVGLSLDSEVATVDNITLDPEHGGGFAILTCPSRLVRQMRLTFDIKPGETIAVDEVLAMPAAHLLWGIPCETDAPAPSDCLTDGIIGAEPMAVWPKGIGTLRFDLQEDWFAQSLIVHFRRLDGRPFSPSAGVEGLRATADDEGFASIPLHRPVRHLTLTVQDRDGGVVAVDEVALLPAPNLALGCPYTLDPPFPPKYPDIGGLELTDGQTTRGFGDGKTVGWASWEGIHTVTVAVDLGETRPISAVEAHLQGGGYAGVRFPKRTAVAVSDDGRLWTKVAESRAEPMDVEPCGENCALGWLRVPTPSVRGRFVKLHFWPEGWLMLSEVRVLSDGQNVALGRPYSLTPQPT
ncbi:MAG: DUF4855 domain-containing protein, partial [Planctomycetes bacterium]|nr:DUF4855 domain-containing protein [Planctomycetota bacterium]